MLKEVKKYVLDNGLTVLVRSVHYIPKVSMQLWYGVGSKDERSGERGLAHLLEHMLFKGTNKLSEPDINLITSKLSGYANAFTSYDYTGYLFDFPTQHWTVGLDLLAECMRNCTLKQEHLNSEFKAVIQELKMYRDDYESTLTEEMVSTIFSDHPYHYPIIGYKQDLWNTTRHSMVNFYQKHYVPNNATLVVVGDVEPEQVYEQSKKYFGHIPTNPTYEKKEYYLNADISSQSITLHRDIALPLVMFSWMVSGMKDRQGYYLDILCWILACGRGSRLYKKLVEELGLVTHIDAFNYGLFEHGLFFIKVYLKNIKDFERVKQVIVQEINALLKDGISDEELSRAMKKEHVAYTSMFDSVQDQAYVIGETFLATGDENYIFNYIDRDVKRVKSVAHSLVENYLRPSLMHVGSILPLDERDRKYWIECQERSDKEDERILARRVREAEIEDGSYVDTVVSKAHVHFNFPQHQSATLKNGMLLVWYATDKSEKIEIVLRLKGRFFYDPPDLPGLGHFTQRMLLEGTTQYDARQLAQEFESRGMFIAVRPGQISITLLKGDLRKALELLTEMLTNPIFPKEQIEKVRSQIIAELQDFWDTPSTFAIQLAKEQVYRDHPYAQNPMGTLESIKKITREDILDFFQNYISPVQAQLAIVGDFFNFDIRNLCKETIGAWQGQKIEDIVFEPLLPVEYKEITYEINRDQVVLCFAGGSVSRIDTDYDALLLFDQIFIGGSLGSMSSRLFQLREQTGMFYTIGGSLIFGAELAPGMVLIKTIVSLENVESAKEKIKQEIENAVKFIADQELIDAKNSIVGALINSFESNHKMAENFLFLESYGLPKDYFDLRMQILETITIDEIKDAVARVLNNEQLVVIQIGRSNDT